MPIRSGLIVAIKIFMIILAFNALLVVITIAGAVDLPGLSRGVALAATCLVFVPILLIFWSAGWIVDTMSPKSTEVAPETAIRTDDLQAIAFSAVGAYIIYDAIRGSVFTLALLQRSDLLSTTSAVTSPINPIVAWVIGLYLLIGAPGIRQLIMQLRRSGAERRSEK